VAEWENEIEVDEALARRLIASQFPAVPLERLELLGRGWDNAAWLADGRWVFRLPRRAIGVEGIERELAFLPRLAPLLPLPIPAPVFNGRPGNGYPWPFAGASFIPGSEPGAVDGGGNGALARPLGGFLRALHDPATLAAVDPGGALPDDPMGRADMSVRVPLALERVAELEEARLWRAPDGLVEELAQAEGLVRPPGPALVHGDLHFRHLIVTPAGELTGVIDWGDLCRGDPAVDLGLLWSLFTPDERPAFLSAYGEVPAERLARARVLAIFLCATLALSARHEHLPAIQREAVAGLDRATL
jgi:aminoglycoside phosphotransferase (APT) family kinase protein